MTRTSSCQENPTGRNLGGHGEKSPKYVKQNPAEGKGEAHKSVVLREIFTLGAA